MNTVSITHKYSTCAECRYIQFWTESEVLPNGYQTRGNPDWCNMKRREIKDKLSIPDWCPLLKRNAKTTKSNKMKTMKPRKNCPICNGRGHILYADSWDRDNGKECFRCKKIAKQNGAKLILPYLR